MTTIQFNEKELVAYVKEQIAADENLDVAIDDISEIVEVFLERLKEAPMETIADLIIDEIYMDATEDDEEDEK